MAFRWRVDDGPTLNAGLKVCHFQGIRTSIAKTAIFFVIFQGAGVRNPFHPSLDPHRFVCMVWLACI